MAKTTHPMRRAVERRAELIAMLRTDNRIDNAVAAEILETTTETIRKDVIALEDQGLLRRVHGGALPLHAMTYEPDIASRTEHLDEKKRIAARALQHVPDGGAIIIDAGTTTQFFAEMLPSQPELVAITNTLSIAQALVSKRQIQVFVLGGRLRPLTLASVGPTVLERLEALHADVAFVGTNAISYERGLSTPDPDEAAVKAAMIRAADKVVLLVDHSKFGEEALVKYAGLDDIDVVITGDEISDEDRTELSALNTTLETA